MPIIVDFEGGVDPNWIIPQMDSNTSFIGYAKDKFGSTGIKSVTLSNGVTYELYSFTFTDDNSRMLVQLSGSTTVPTEHVKLTVNGNVFSIFRLSWKSYSANSANGGTPDMIQFLLTTPSDKSTAIYNSFINNLGKKLPMTIVSSSTS